MLVLLFLYLLLRPPPDIMPPPCDCYKPLTCFSLYGLETPLRNTVCSWKHPGSYYIAKAKEVGFDTVRIPVSVEYIVEGDYKVLDSLFNSCQELDVRAILDFHRVTSNRQEESWDQGIKESSKVHSREDFIAAVLWILERYKEVSQLIGTNSWNEYTGTNSTFKKEWDTLVFGKIEEAFPGRFLYFATGLMWGNTLANYTLEDLPYAERIIYEIHKYPFSGTADREDWEKTFGTLQRPTKLMIGEYGFRFPEEAKWGREFVAYLQEKKIQNHCFWTVAHSGDTGGLWKDDCDTVDEAKLKIIKPLLS